MKDIPKLRIEVANTIRINLALINKNPIIIQDIADAILMQVIESDQLIK